METKCFKIKKQTVNITVESKFNNYLKEDDLSEIAAFLLLTGQYNPLRQYSPADNPIDLEKLKTYKNEFNNILYSMKKDMNIDLAKLLSD
jgi:hypothetical protein